MEIQKTCPAGLMRNCVVVRNRGGKFFRMPPPAVAQKAMKKKTESVRRCFRPREAGVGAGLPLELFLRTTFTGKDVHQNEQPVVTASSLPSPFPSQ